MDPYSAPHIDGLAAAPAAGRVVAAVPLEGFTTHDLEQVGANDLDWSLDPEPEHVATAAEPEPPRRRIGWLAPLIFLFGLFIAGVGALMALMAAVVGGVVLGLLLLMPSSAGTSDAEFILVPDTLPVQEEAADGSDAEFILVPDTLPVQEASPKAKAPKRKTRPAAPARPAPSVQKAPKASAAPPVEEAATGGKAKVSLESVPLDEAVRRVKGKAGRGEARSSRGH